MFKITHRILKTIIRTTMKINNKTIKLLGLIIDKSLKIEYGITQIMKLYYLCFEKTWRFVFTFGYLLWNHVTP